MHVSRSLLKTVAASAVALAAIMALAAAAPVRPPAASAQTAETGQFCPDAAATGQACQSPQSGAVTVSSFTTCSDGSVVSGGQACPTASSAPSGQFCPGSFAAGLPCQPLQSAVAAPAVTSVVTPALSETIPLPPDQYVLVSDPWATSAVVSGADIVLAFDPRMGGFFRTTTLAPGQSAWVLSIYGGMATLTALSS